MHLKKIALLICLFISNFLISQIDNYRKQYPNEDVITVSLEKHINIKESRGKLLITESVHKRNAFLTTEELEYTEDVVSYNTFNQIKEIKGNTQNIEKGKLKYNEVTDFVDKDVMLRGVFYNDQKERKIIFPNVKENSITDLKYVKNISDAHFIPSFIFWSRIPILKAKVSISFPNNVKVAYKEFNIENVDINFEEKNENGITTYIWVLNKIPKINRHYDFSPVYYIPQIITYINSYTHKGKTTPILNNVNDLYQWYVSLTSNINSNNQQKLKALANDLVKDAKTEEDKIKYIYYYIQDKINYVAFEDGLNGFIPRDIDKVFANKYGDCKDMANILNEMLRYVGVNSYLTWIGTRNKPYSYKDVPTPVTDNHMITSVITKENDTLFLDATAKYLPYGYPSPFIQGKEALIGLSNSNYVIKKVPETSSAKNRIDFINELSFENNKLLGKHKVYIQGHEKLKIMHKLENKDKDNLDFLYWNLNFGTKQTAFNNINYNNLQRLKDSIKISFNTETEKYIKNIGNKLYVKPNLDFFLKDDLIKDEKKKYDKKIEFKSIKNFLTTLNIPDGYMIDFLPTDESFKNENFNYEIAYKQEGKTILIHKTIIINTLKINTTNIPKWNSFIKSVLKSNKKTIVLKPKTKL